MREEYALRLVAVVGLLCTSFLFDSGAISAQEWEVFEDHALKKSGTGKKPLGFNDTDAQSTEEFVDICKSMCESGEADGKKGACGGLVLNYTNKTKVRAKFCAFKKEGSQPYVKEIKDTYLIMGYGTAESAPVDEDEYDEEDTATESAAADEEIATPEFLTIDPDSDYFKLRLIEPS